MKNQTRDNIININSTFQMWWRLPVRVASMVGAILGEQIIDEDEERQISPLKGTINCCFLYICTRKGLF